MNRLRVAMLILVLVGWLPACMAPQEFFEVARDSVAYPRLRVYEQAQQGPAYASTGMLAMLLRGDLCHDIPMAKALLDAGADPNWTYSNVVKRYSWRVYGRWTSRVFKQRKPIYWIALERCPTPELAKLLHDAGADPMATGVPRPARWPHHTNGVALNSIGMGLKNVSWFSEYVRAIANQRGAGANPKNLAYAIRVFETMDKDDAERGDRPALVYLSHLCAKSPSATCRSQRLRRLLPRLAALHPPSTARAAAVPAIEAGDVDWVVALLRGGPAADGRVSTEESVAGEVFVPLKYDGLNLLDITALLAPDAAVDELVGVLRRRGLEPTPPEQLAKIFASNERRARERAQAKAEQRAEEERELAGRQRNLDVSNCIARGVEGDRCMANPNAQREESFSADIARKLRDGGFAPDPVPDSTKLVPMPNAGTGGSSGGRPSSPGGPEATGRAVAENDEDERGGGSGGEGGSGTSGRGGASDVRPKYCDEFRDAVAGLELPREPAVPPTPTKPVTAKSGNPNWWDTEEKARKYDAVADTAAIRKCQQGGGETVGDGTSKPFDCRERDGQFNCSHEVTYQCTVESRLVTRARARRTHMENLIGLVFPSLRSVRAIQNRYHFTATAPSEVRSLLQTATRVEEALERVRSAKKVLDQKIGNLVLLENALSNASSAISRLETSSSSLRSAARSCR